MTAVNDSVSRDSGPVPDSGSHPDARPVCQAPDSRTEIPSSTASVPGPLDELRNQLLASLARENEQLFCDISLLLQKIEREHVCLRNLENRFRYFNDEDGDEQTALRGAAKLTDISARIVREELRKRGVVV